MHFTAAALLFSDLDSVRVGRCIYGGLDRAPRGANQLLRWKPSPDCRYTISSTPQLLPLSKINHPPASTCGFSRVRVQMRCAQGEYRAKAGAWLAARTVNPKW
jgi:hypothetical protein